MANDMQPKGKNKALTVIIIAIVVLLVVILAVVALSKKDTTTAGDNSNVPATATDDQAAAPTMDGEEGIPGTEEMVGEFDNIPEALIGAEAEVEGGNLVSVDNQVITEEGEEAQNNLQPMTPGAPHQTVPIEEADLPDSAIKIGVSAAGFEPAEIRVNANSPVTLAVTSTDTATHVFKFRDASMSSIAVGILSGETKAITFQTPAPGEYIYFCDIPGHAGRGETGVMIVE